MIEEKPVPTQKVFDAGISIDDAKAIKQYLLNTALQGHVGAGEFFTFADDMCSAFRLVDDEVYRRDVYTRKQVADEKKKLEKLRKKTSGS